MFGKRKWTAIRICIYSLSLLVSFSLITTYYASLSYALTPSKPLSCRFENVDDYRSSLLDGHLVVPTNDIELICTSILTELVLAQDIELGVVSLISFEPLRGLDWFDYRENWGNRIEFFEAKRKQYNAQIDYILPEDLVIEQFDNVVVFYLSESSLSRLSLAGRAAYYGSDSLIGPPYVLNVSKKMLMQDACGQPWKITDSTRKEWENQDIVWRLLYSN